MRLNKEPVPGVTVEPASDDLYTWIVGMFGAPGTIYEGGYFKARMKFPETYPMDPPSMKMMQPMWHPNIYVDASVMFRNHREEYNAKVAEEVAASKLVAQREGVEVPVTVEDYVIQAKEEEVVMDTYDTSDDEKYVVQLDSASDSENDETASEDGDTAAEDDDNDDKGKMDEEVEASEVDKQCAVGSKRTADMAVEC